MQKGEVPYARPWIHWPGTPARPALDAAHSFQVVPREASDSLRRQSPEDRVDLIGRVGDVVIEPPEEQTH